MILKVITRFGALLCISHLVILTWAQSTNPAVPKGFFQSTRPDILVQVSRHPLGPNMFVVSAINPGFSPQVLSDAISEFGKNLGSDPRGLIIQNTAVKTVTGDQETFVKASFAVDGFATPSELKLQPLVRAFTGLGGSSAVRALDVTLIGFAPNSQYLQTYSGPDPKNPSVIVAGRAYDHPLGLEYKIRVLNQSPAQIQIPNSLKNQANMEIVKPSSNTMVKVFMIGFVILAAIGIGIFVYNLLLEPGKRAKSGSRSVNR